MSMTQREAGTFGASLCAAASAATYTTQTTHTTHAHAYAAKFWATKNFAAYGVRGTWSSTR